MTIHSCCNNLQPRYYICFIIFFNYYYYHGVWRQNEPGYLGYCSLLQSRGLIAKNGAKCDGPS